MEKCIIVDIDGTLTKDSLTIEIKDDVRKSRDDFYQKVKFYTVVEPVETIPSVVTMVQYLYDNGVKPIFLTAREDGVNGLIRTNTLKLLDVIFPNMENKTLLMRENNDPRQNYLVKKELYEKNIKGKYEVLFAMDDEIGNVQMFQGEGLVVLQVKDSI